MHKQKTLRLV